MAELAHRLAYYKDIVTHGSAVRLNIYQKTTLYPITQEIGDVLVSMSYGIQGSGEAVDEPIQKTSLEFSLADAPERNTQKERWGGWETFYTPDATGFKVELVIDGVVRWTGFITPDSWEEDLSWHAPVTITARDNWGRLQDFMFDLAGDEDHLISVADLLTAAAQKAEVAMEVTINEDVAWPFCNGFPLYEHMINVLAFKDRTWWDALYDTLGSLGLVLTYEDGNRFVLAPLRSRVAKGEGKEFKFVASGHRSLAPAVREIVETQNYEFSEDMINAPELTIADFNAGSTYPFTTQPYGVTEKVMPVFSLRSGGFWKQGTSGTYYSLLCQFNYTPRQNDDAVRLKDGKTLFLACNPGTAADYATAQNKMRGVYCEVNMTKMRAELSFRVGAPVRLYGSDYNTGTAPYSAEVTSPAIASIHARIVYTPAIGSAKCFNGSAWVTGNTPCTLTPPTSEGAAYEAAFVIPSADIDAPGVLRIEFICGKYIIRGEYTDAGNGMYMPITELKMTGVWATEAENKVTTKYSEGNNVILERQPAVGCLNFDTTSPNEVLNGVYTPTLGRPASREWRWSDEDATTYQLPVLLHKELLCYHGKPNNVLTGEMIVDDLKGLPSFDSLWLWRGKEHLLMAGRVNLVSGTMEGAELREFVRYEDMW